VESTAGGRHADVAGIPVDSAEPGLDQRHTLSHQADRSTLQGALRRLEIAVSLALLGIAEMLCCQVADCECAEVSRPIGSEPHRGGTQGHSTGRKFDLVFDSGGAFG